MKQLLSTAVVVALVASFGLTLLAGAQAVNGAVSGVVSDPGGPIGSVKVNIVNSSGAVPGSTVTSSLGAYVFGNLPAGTYTIQVVDNAGNVLGTGTGVVSATAPAVTVNIVLTSRRLAGAAIAAGNTGVGLTTKVVLAAGAAAGAGILVARVVGDSSPNR